MKKLTMQTKDITDENIAKLKALFPNAVTEIKDDDGNVREAIDFDVLRQELSHQIVEGREERYQFTWPDKKKAMHEANTPINKTLRPVVEDSVGKDGTPGGFDSENLYIEGDNLDVLKLLRETYLGKIKMIYIDPPYNTGNDFIYDDDFSMDSDQWSEVSGQKSEEGFRMVQNNESNGRFHTDWLNMMYPRLKLAKDLLSEDGVIFISIDDNEVDNLRKICDEVFGRISFISSIIWQKRTSPDARRIISSAHEYILIYTKCIEFGHELLNQLPFDMMDTARYKNPDNDPNGPWISTDCTAQGGHGTKEQFYDFVTPSGRIVKLQNGLCWRYTKERMQEEINAGHIWFGIDGNGVPRKKTYLKDIGGKNVWTWWSNQEVGHTQEATKELNILLDATGIMDFPKPSRLLKRIVTIGSNKQSIILDFFSGSATTAHAVMQLNAEDGGHRKYIMVQLPELTNEKSEAYKAGYKNICEIGKERIRRAGKKILAEHNVGVGGGQDLHQNGQRSLDLRAMMNDSVTPKGVSPNQNPSDTLDKGTDNCPLTTDNSLDIGFRVFRVDSSNMKDVFYRPKDYTKELLDIMEGNIKPDRSPMDLLFQVMLELGISLSSPIEETAIQGKRVFNVDHNVLIACFDNNIDESVITAIARQKPYYFVMRDSGMASDSVAANFEQIFETFSRDTVRRVL